MTKVLYIAAMLLFVVGVAHTVLGERFILSRLFRRDNLPKILGSTEFTKRTLRFAWHLTTIAWWGFAAIIVLLAQASLSFQNVSMILAVTFLITGAVALIASRGRHLSWPLFLFVGGACLYAALL